MGQLDRYHARRDFSATPEPSDPGRTSTLALRYSMQKHDATRLHFDLRLEWDGVLLSWAVTRGPSLDPAEKRLAVRTEDHPLSYLSFEGPIPAGSYGAGTVMLFDIGHWQPLEPAARGLEKGHLKFRLHGQRLTGDWHLVRLKGRKPGDKGRENWLMMKIDDDAAQGRDPVARWTRSALSGRTMREITAAKPPVTTDRDGALPKFRPVQLATLKDEAPEGADWWSELKFDGYRAQVALGRGGPRLYTRSGLDWSDRFAALLPGFAPLACDSALIDGEVVAGAGLDGFSNLQAALKAGGPFTFYAFDLLALDGKDLTARPLAARRKALEGLFRDAPPLGPVQLSPVLEAGPATLATICTAGGEGIIAKRTDLPYRGGRSRGWLKVKCRRSDEFVILGWQESDKTGRPFASLALGAHRGGGLVYVGKVGTGFDGATMDSLAAAMAPLARKTPAAEVPRAEARGLRWVTPSLVAQVDYAEMTADKRLRHAVFQGLREDKPARSVRLEGDRMKDDRIEIAGVRISNPDREVYPGTGITKRDVADYCAAMADPLLRFAADRPLSLLRLPEGLGGEQFFQKHRTAGLPEGLKPVTITESGGGKAEYLYVDSAAGLVGAVQMGTLEFHIQGVRRDRLDRPDRLVFDLDPDEGLDFADVTGAAQDLRDLLADLELVSWPLLTGGKGVHVVVQLTRRAGWDTVKLFAQTLAAHLAQAEPGRFTASMAKARRQGRIFIDWLRNDRGATAIAPFSPRARPGAPVAVPLGWDELGKVKAANAFTLDAARERAGWTPPAAVTLGARAIDGLHRLVGQG